MKGIDRTIRISGKFSAPTRCTPTKFSTTWSGAIPSLTPRWCRFCMFTRRWKSGVRKARRRRIWSLCSPTTRSPVFKPSKILPQTCPRSQENILPQGGTMNTSGTEHCPCWPESTCCPARFWAWCAYPYCARQSFRTHLQRDPHFPGHAAKPVCIRLHAQTRVLAQLDRIVFR